MDLISCRGTSKIICTSAVAGATRSFVKLNVKHLKRWVEFGQSPALHGQEEKLKTSIIDTNFL